MMTELVIQNLVFPDVNALGDDDLYVRTYSNSYIDRQNQCISIEKGGKVDLETFFNLFPVSHWCEYTKINSFGVDLEFKGNANVKLIEIDPSYYTKKIISQSTIESGNKVSVTRVFDNININDKRSYFFLEIHCPKTPCQIYTGSVIGFIPKEEVSAPSLSIVMCTYKREFFANKNITKILEEFDKHKELFSNSKLIVVDNAKTIDNRNHPNFKLIYNNNLGGSGGFSRGLIDVLEKTQKTTHVLLCDDDINLPDELIYRSTIMLSLLKDKRMGIHGCMLELERPNILHELGEHYDVYRNHINFAINLDVSTRQGTRQAAFSSVGNTKTSNLFPWWFLIIPIDLVRETGMPFPFFVKGDDMDYSMSLRKKGFSTLVCPGMAVWHSSHTIQHGKLPSYLSTRNMLSLKSFHVESNYYLFKQIFKIILGAANQALLKKYGTSMALLVGVEDFLKGPSWIYESLESWTVRLGDMTAEKNKPLRCDAWHTPIDPINPEFYKEKLLRKWVRRLTLNGHILSRIWVRVPETPTDIGHVTLNSGVYPRGKARALAFRAGSILYYDEQAGVGYVVKHDSKAFWKVVRKMLKVSLLAALRAPKLHTEYASAHKEATTLEWWKKRLDLK